MNNLETLTNLGSRILYNPDTPTNLGSSIDNPDTLTHLRSRMDNPETRTALGIKNGQSRDTDNFKNQEWTFQRHIQQWKLRINKSRDTGNIGQSRHTDQFENQELTIQRHITQPWESRIGIPKTQEMFVKRRYQI